MVALLAPVVLLVGCGQGPEESDAASSDSGNSSSDASDSVLSKPATSGKCKGVSAESCDIAAQEGTSSEPSKSPVVAIDTSDKGSVRVRAEIADDTNEMTRGLMGRTALAEDAGMLFVYPEEQDLSFWMKDTLIPLSIAFMDSEGRIVDIQDMKALDDELPHYTSAEPAQYALEVNEGFFDERGVEVGDGARLPV